MTVVLYHANCADGFCAAWVAYRAMRSAYAAGTVSFHPVNYDSRLPEIPANATVFLLDFSLKREAMRSLIRSVKRVILLDHHKTAIKDLEGLADEFKDRPLNDQPDIFFDVEKSGGQMAWQYFFPGEPEPLLVRYTADRDLWKWELSGSRAFSEALWAYPKTFAEWDAIHEDPDALRRLGREGNVLLTAKHQRIQSHLARAFETTLFGVRILAVNATTDQSEIANELAVGRLFGACFTLTPDGVVWSLRSKPDGADVSKIAAAFGGGGHKHAAGFTQRLQGVFEVP